MSKSVLLLTIAVLMPLPAALGAVGMTWSTGGAEQFAQGKLDGVSVVSTGEVELAPQSEKIEGLEAEFVWDVAIGEDGTVYAATGGPAVVYAVRGGRAEPIHKSDQQHVLSVLALPDGSVLAGTGPKGIIHRISRTGKVTPFATLDASYVWDMALGPHSEIYCATGSTGKLFKLNRAGEGSEVLKVKQKNLMCVAVGSDGTVYVGTDTDGYVYRVDASGRATVLYDAEEDEVHALVMGAEGALYACTAQGQPSGARGGSAGGRSEGTGEAPSPPFVAPPAAGAPAAANSLYRIVPERGGELLLRLDRTFMLSLAPLGEQVLVGTGTGGRMLSVGPGVLTKILAELDASHVTAMAVAPNGDIVVGTANAGSLRRLIPGARRTGTFLSKPFDAGYLSRWGRLWWKQVAGPGLGLRVRLRTGNSGEPDEHWSNWSGWVSDPAGASVDVPAGRFAQFSAELSASPAMGTPRLVQVSVSYLQDNRRPRIEDLIVNGESMLGKAEREGGPPRGRPTPPSRPGPPRQQEGPPGQMAIAWKASDPNEDELAYELHYRGLDETEWKKIEDNLRDTNSYVWDTSRVPDGYYVLKIVASDRVSRPGPEALADEKVTVPVLIDNRGPSILQLKAIRNPDGSFELTGTAQDELSGITKIEVSKNSGEWEPIFPNDGILDSPQESFRYVTGVLEGGEHVFVVAARDGSGNSGSGKLVVRVAGGAR